MRKYSNFDLKWSELGTHFFRMPRASLKKTSIPGRMLKQQEREKKNVGFWFICSSFPPPPFGSPLISIFICRCSIHEHTSPDRHSAGVAPAKFRLVCNLDHGLRSHTHTHREQYAHFKTVNGSRNRFFDKNILKMARGLSKNNVSPI